MNRQTLKQWFSRGKKPTETQFAELIDSYWHKEEDAIQMSDVENLNAALAGKANTADLANVNEHVEQNIERIALLEGEGGNVLYSAHLDPDTATTVILTDEEPELLISNEGTEILRYIVIDHTVEVGGVVHISNGGHTASGGEKTLIEFPADNFKPTAIKLTDVNGNIVHWLDYEKGKLYKVYYQNGVFHLTADNKVPSINDIRLKRDLLDVDTAEENATLHLQDTFEVERNGETVAQSGQWGFRMNGLVEMLRAGVATIWNGMGQFILHATTTGTHLFFGGRNVFSADSHATSVKHHRKVMCFGATFVPVSERTGTVPSNVYRKQNYPGTGDVIAIDENGNKVNLTSYHDSSWYTGNYDYYALTATKDHYYYEDNTVVSGGVDEDELAQFTTLNLGEGKMFSAGIGNFGGEDVQPPLPYGYTSEKWYWKIFDPLRRVVIGQNSEQNNGDVVFYRNGVERMRFTSNGVEFNGGVSVLEVYYTNGTKSINQLKFGNLSRSGLNGGVVNSGGYVSNRYNDSVIELRNATLFHKIDVHLSLNTPVDKDIVVEIGGMAYSNPSYYGPSTGVLHAGSTELFFSLYYRGIYPLLSVHKENDYSDMEISIKDLSIVITKL